jgi:hypothetical protein
MTKSRQPLYGSAKAKLILELFLLLSALLLMNWAACAAPESTLAGKWRGFITESDQRRIRVDLTVKPTMECTLHYGATRRCQLEAESAGSEGNLHHFRFKESNGGFCDKLFNGAMSLKVNPDGTLTLRVWCTDKGIDESVGLEKQS